jgi:hypothetical protein
LKVVCLGVANRYIYWIKDHRSLTLNLNQRLIRLLTLLLLVSLILRFFSVHRLGHLSFGLNRLLTFLLLVSLILRFFSVLRLGHLSFGQNLLLTLLLLVNLILRFFNALSLGHLCAVNPEDFSKSFAVVTIFSDSFWFEHFFYILHLVLEVIELLHFNIANLHVHAFKSFVVFTVV